MLEMIELLAAVQAPRAMVAGIIPLEQPPGPEMGPDRDGATLPDTPVGAMVPTTVPLIAQFSQATRRGRKTPRRC